MQAGASQEKIAQVAHAATSDLFSAIEKVAIEYAETMTVTGRKVDDALFTRVRKHFSEAQIVELTAAVALEVPEQLWQRDKQSGAHHHAQQIPRSTQDDHGEDVDRLCEEKVLREHRPLPGGQEAPADASKRGAHGEGLELGDRRVDSHGL